MSLKYPVYSSLPLSPAKAGTPNSLIAGYATLIPVTGKVNVSAFSDVVKPLSSFEIPGNRIHAFEKTKKAATF